MKSPNVGAIPTPPANIEGYIMMNWIDGNCSIPEVSDEIIQERLKKFTPVLYNREWNCIQKFELPDLKKTAYTWNPKFIGEPLRFKVRETIDTNHSCGYYGIFKPSLYEVLAQIPENCDSEANAFWIDLDQDIQIFRSGEDIGSTLT